MLDIDTSCVGRLPLEVAGVLAEEGVDIDALSDAEFAALEAAVSTDAGGYTDAGELPHRLDEVAPGPALAAALDAVDVDRLSGYDRIVYLRAQQRLVSHYNAGVYDTMAAVADYMQRLEDYADRYTETCEAAAAEIRAALRLTRRTADDELTLALDLAERLPEVWEALRSGDIDIRRAKTIIYHTGHLPAALAREVATEVLDDAPRLTTGQLRARLAKLAIAADPKFAKERYERSQEQRRLVATPTIDGTADLCGYELAPHYVVEVMDRINSIARSLRGPGETRTMDQLRADVYLDLLRGTNHTKARRGVVDVHASVSTLQGRDDDPGYVDGWGPVIADIARQTVADSHDSEWRWTVSDPDSGAVLDNGTTRRRPTRKQRRAVQARWHTCIFPGCRMPAVGCDIDHRIPHAEGGPTATSHLGPLCRHDHCVRHQHKWTYQRLPNGDHQWTTQLGHTYTTSGAPP